MSATFVDAAMAGDGQSSTVSSQSITVPAGIAANDVAVIFVDDSTAADTLSVSGWSQISQDANGSNSKTAAFGRILVAGDASAAEAIAGLASGGTRVVSDMLVFRGVTLGGALVAVNQETTATSSPTLPALSGVPAGAMLVCGFLRRRSGAAGNITLPAGYTQPASNASPGTAYGSGVNVFADAGYQVTASGGLVGGESGSSGVTAVGNNYLLALPLAAATASVVGSISLGGTAAGKAPDTATGSISLGGTVTGKAPATAGGAISLDGLATSSSGPPSAMGAVTLDGLAAPAALAQSTPDAGITLDALAAVQVSTLGAITLGGGVTAQARASAVGSITLGSVVAVGQTTIVFFCIGDATMRTLTAAAPAIRRLAGDPKIRSLVGALEDTC